MNEYKLVLPYGFIMKRIPKKAHKNIILRGYPNVISMGVLLTWQLNSADVIGEKWVVTV